MIVYLDLAFVLNCLSDALALYVTARLSGVSFRWTRLVTAALLGGTYGVLCMLPPFVYVSGLFLQMVVAVLLVWIAFGQREMLLRYSLLFFILSCTLGGILVALVQYSAQSGVGDLLKHMNWKVFFLAGILSWFLLSVIFRSSTRHVARGEIFEGRIELSGKTVEITVLRDTGHTLSDPFSGEWVLTVWYDALQRLWSREEATILSLLASEGSVSCIQKLAAIAPGRYRLIPYRAVGVKEGTLLCFRADEVVLDGRSQGALTIALSPTPVSDGGSYVALWGGEMKGREHKCKR